MLCQTLSNSNGDLCVDPQSALYCNSVSVEGGGVSECRVTTNTEQQALMHTPYTVGLPGYMCSAYVGYPPFLTLFFPW